MSTPASTETPSLRLPEFIDSRRLRPYQYRVALLCGLVMLLDGFDTQVVNYMAPKIAADWGLKSAALGPIFSSALVGLMIGYLVVAPFSDRFGHRRLVVAGTSLFAVSTLASYWVGGVDALMVLRLVTGIGLGAATPSAIALTSEYSPKRVRASFVLAIYCCFSLGFVLAGAVAGWIMPISGWRSAFLVGAIAPLVLVPLLVWNLPESMAFLMRRRGDHAAVYAQCRKIDRTLPAVDEPQVSYESAAPGKRVSVRALFAPSQIVGTVLLWIVFAINLGMFYALQSWLPTILEDRHLPTAVVVTATSLTTIGGIVIAFVVGPAMDRLGAYGALGTLYFAGCGFLAFAAFGLGAPVWVLFLASFLLGCSISGGQKSVIALAAVYYPAEVRSTGVGWALGIGRVGSIVAPLILGAALSGGWSAEQIFLAMILPSAVCGVLVFVLGRRGRKEPAAAV